MLACGTGFGELRSVGFRPFLCHPSHLTLHGCPLARFQLVLCTKPSVVPSPHPPPLPTRTRSLFRNQEFGLIDYFSWVSLYQPPWTCSLCLCAFSVSPSLLPRQASGPTLYRCHLRGLCLFQPTGVLCVRTDLPLAWALVAVNSFKSRDLSVILIATPWGVHRSRHSDAYSLVGRRQRKPTSGVQRVDMEKTFQAFGDSWNDPCWFSCFWSL